MSHARPGGEPTAAVAMTAGSPVLIARSDHPTMGCGPFHQGFRGQTDANGLPFVAHPSEADLLGAGLGDETVYGWARADHLFGGSSQMSGIPPIGSGFDATVWKHRLTGKDSHKIHGMATPTMLPTLLLTP